MKVYIRTTGYIGPLLFVIVLFLLATASLAHDHWIRHGGYLAQTEKALDPYPNGCCGKGDCFIQPYENVTETPAGFYFPATHPEALKRHRGGYFFPFRKANLSKDGQFWACFNTSDWTVKCFFYPLNT